MTEGKGVPVALVLAGANRHAMKKLADLLAATVVERPAVPDEAPADDRPHLCVDRGYA